MVSFSNLHEQLLGSLPEGAFSTGRGHKQPGENIPSGYRKFGLEQFTPEQTGLFGQLFPHLGPESYLSKLASGDQSTFSQIEEPALRQFNELQGNLASRFSGMGLGGRKSSGFQNASNAAASDFASQLQSQRQGLTKQALLDLMGMSEMLLNQRPWDIGLVEKGQKQPSFLQGVGTNFANSVAKSFGENVGKGGANWMMG